MQLRSWVVDWITHIHVLSLHVIVRGPGGARPEYTLRDLFSVKYT